MLLVVGMLSISAQAAVDNSGVSDEYFGTATEFSDETVTVDLTIDDTYTISEIMAMSNRGSTREKLGNSYLFWHDAPGILGRIKTTNGTDDVDAATGATFCSIDIRDAAEIALTEAVTTFA